VQVALLALLAVGCKRKEAPDESATPEPANAAQRPSAASDPKTSEPLPRICFDLCKRAPAIECGTIDTCVDGCQRMLALPVCQTEVLAFMNCAAAQPDKYWECDQAGPTPSLKEAYCKTQRDALTGCIAKASGNTAPQP
jgi:hypothetical protein